MGLSGVINSASRRIKRRMADQDKAENARAEADLAPLKQRFPSLGRYAERAPALAKRFENDYLDYLTRVGHPNHAASLELIATLWLLAEDSGARRIIDLGSGFTSFILRTYAAEHPGVEVWSVDDSAEWLERTRGWLGEKGVSTAHLYTWDNLMTQGRHDFDLVLHDMGMMDTRARCLTDAVGLAREGGLVILDDVHMAEYRAHVAKTLEGRTLWSLKRFTRDPITRYAWLLAR